MSDSKDKKKPLDQDDSDELLPVRTSPRVPSKTFQGKKIIRHINPLGMRVVVRIRERADTTDGGLFIPDNAKSTMTESLLAEVLEVASAIDDETYEEANISGIPLGATVLIPKNVGVKVPWDESLRIVDTKDILGTVEELDII